MISFRSGRCGRIRLQAAEQEVDVEAALVRLVDDDRVVAAQQPVVLDLGEQQAVGHQPHERVLARAVVEAHRVADRLAERTSSSSAIRSATVRAASRRGCVWRDRAAHAAAELEAELRQLGRLARAGLAGDDDDLVVADRLEQVLAARADRQLRRIGDRRHGRAPARRRAPRPARSPREALERRPHARRGSVVRRSCRGAAARR